MRARTAGALSVGVAALVGAGTALLACTDLFISTGDVITACEIDATTPGCGGDAGPVDVCTWTHADALAHAQHACAWLGACETPLGRNAFGPCMFQALQAYDCAANPDHPPKGEARALWDCLWQVGSCKNVEKCVFPKGDQPCNASDFVRCSNLPEAGEVRLDCETTGAAAPGENCALWGQTCVNVSGVEATCTGDPGTVGCSTSTCAGTVARWCADGGIAGIDCSLSGGQACALQGRGSSDAGAGGEGGNASGDAGDADAAETGDGSAGSAGHYPVCAPSGDGGTCAFDASASCSGGVATSCPDGVIERVDCAALLGGAMPSAACTPGPLSPPFDWTSPCSVTPPTCTQDSCQGNVLTGCFRGASYTVDCQKEVGTACGMQTTDRGAATNAACAHP